MFKKLKRWHFDAAIFVGLASFALAYWYSMPRPIGRWPLRISSAAPVTPRQMIQVSEDNQFIYLLDASTASFIEAKALGSRVAHHIEKRSVSTGALVDRMPLQLPDEVAQADTAGDGTVSFNVEEETQLPVISTVRQVSKNERRYWFYHGRDGRCLGPAIVINQEAVHHLVIRQPSKEGHTWVIFFSLDRSQPSKVYDANNGQLLHEYPTSKDERAMFASLTPGGEYLVQFWSLNKGKYDIEVFRMPTWESLGRFHISDGIGSHHRMISETLWAFSDLVKTDPNSTKFEYQLRYFRFDPTKKTLTHEPSHPADSEIGKNPRFIEPPFLIRAKFEAPTRSDSSFLNMLESWLNQISVYRDYTQRTSYQLDDMTTGQPLRRISGLPNNVYKLSPDGCSIYCIQPSETTLPDSRTRIPDMDLCKFTVPHYLWDATLSWIQWLSWLLVIPWPMRYFVGMSRPVISSVPPSANGLPPAESAVPPSSSQTA